MDILHCRKYTAVRLTQMKSDSKMYLDGEISKFCFVVISSKLVQGRTHAPRSLVADLLLGVDIGYAANRSGLLLVPKGSIWVTRFAPFR